MFKTKFGFEFDTEEKVKEFEDGAYVCFSGCKDISNPPDIACKTCCLAKECVQCSKEMED